LIKGLSIEIFIIYSILTAWLNNFLNHIEINFIFVQLFDINH
mgnify:CR=1